MILLFRFSNGEVLRWMVSSYFFLLYDINNGYRRSHGTFHTALRVFLPTSKSCARRGWCFPSEPSTSSSGTAGTVRTWPGGPVDLFQPVVFFFSPPRGMGSSGFCFGLERNTSTGSARDLDLARFMFTMTRSHSDGGVFAPNGSCRPYQVGRSLGGVPQSRSFAPKS